MRTPICRMCGEPGIHGDVDACLRTLRDARGRYPTQAVVVPPHVRLGRRFAPRPGFKFSGRAGWRVAP